MLDLSRVASDELRHVGKRVPAKAMDRAMQVDPKRLPDLASVQRGRRAWMLDKTNVAALVPSDPSKLVALVQDGRIGDPSLSSWTFGNVTKAVQRDGGYAALVLSPAGKRALARTEDPTVLDPLLKEGRKGVPGNPKSGDLGLKFGVSELLSRPLDLSTDISHILVDENSYPALMKQYQQAVAQGEAPEKIGGKPFREFFRTSDDLYNDFEAAAFRRTVPGFSELPADAQRSVASLGGRLAATFPQEVPETARRKIAAALVTYQPVDHAAQVGLDAVNDLKAYYHGTRAAEAIAQDGFRVGPRGLYGKGVYYSNPTVSMGYTFSGPGESAQIVSGDVHLGHLATEKMDTLSAEGFNQSTEYDSRHAVRADLINKDNGDYWVTRDPKRFNIKAITTYRPDRSAQLLPMLPDLLEAYTRNPEWASRHFLDKFDPAALTGELEKNLGAMNPDRRRAAGVLLAKQGHSKGMSLTLDAMQRKQTPVMQAASGQAVLQGLKGLPTRESRVAAAKTLLATEYYRNNELAVERSLRSSLGDAAEPLISEARRQAGLGHRVGRWFRESVAQMFKSSNP